MQDVIISPQNYSHPVKRRVIYLYSYLYRYIGQYVYIDLEIANIETNTNLIGFDFLTEEKLETYIKYDSSSAIPTQGYQDFYPIYEFSIQLKDRYFHEKRHYPQLIDLLSEVGGFVESIYSFFNLIGSFIINILYENSMTNTLFSFNLQKKVIKIKNNEKHIKYKMNINKSNIHELNGEQNEEINSNFNLKENLTYPHMDLKFNNNSINSSIDDEIDNIKGKTHLETNSNYNNDKNYNTFRKNKNKKPINKFGVNKKIIYPYMQSRRKINEIKDKDNDNSLNDTQNENYSCKYNDNLIINNVHLNNFLVHFCFLCVRKRNNLQNILLDESINLLSEKLDIINIFKMICLVEEQKQIYKFDQNMINMSNECISSLRKIKIK